jgi:hypothetical protein
MFGYQEISLSLAYPAVYLFLGLAAIALYSFYVYRYTIPQIENYKKIILTSLRVLALLFLILILFEPILNLSRKLTLEPYNLVFIDNSRSIKIEDGTKRESTVNQIMNELSGSASSDNLSFYEFGNSVRDVSVDSFNNVNFSDGATNLQQVFNFIKNSDRNIASITLITDGVITSGTNPYYDAVNTGIPVFTIGIGDTTQRKDVEIKKILHNDFIYAETPTKIIATISNNGFADESVTANLFEDNKFISKQDIILSNAGIQNISFDFTPQSAGEKKLSIELSPLKDEFTKANNKQISYVKILSNKIKVLLLASTPSSDLTFIKNALSRDENIELSQIVQVSQDKFLTKLNYQKLDSAEVLFLIGFPSGNTPEEFFNLVASKIRDSKTPFFITLSSDVSLSRLSRLGNVLPFTISQSFTGYREVQPYISPDELSDPILQYSDKNQIDAWNNLPPVLQPISFFTPRIESKTIAEIIVNSNVAKSPLIISSNFNGKKSIAVLAKDIWKWKLQVAPKGLDLFDNFIVNSLRWLRANEEQKLVSIKTSKKNYSQGEIIEFYGEISDESLNPVSDADVKINISSGTNNFETDLQNVGPGLYEGSIVINETGDFNYSAIAEAGGRTLGKDNGSFNIGEIDIEMINPVMNYSLLNLLANETGGEYYFPNNYAPLLERLKNLKINSSKERMVTSEISLWSSTWMLIISILLFATEWFLRKRNGML